MSFDAIVVGAGVMGSALARRLAGDGLKTLVCGWEAPEHDATWAAAGILCAQAEADRKGPFLDLLLAAEDRWAEFAGRFDYRRHGVLHVALDEDEREGLQRQRRWQQKRGLPVEFLEPADVRRLEPGLTKAVAGANFFPRGGQVDNRSLPAGFLAGAERAEVRSGRVKEVLVEGDRVRGVSLGSERVEAELVVLAAGAWTDQIKGLGIASSRPVRGQIVAFPDSPVTRPVFGAGGYVLPKGKACVCGTTMELVGFDARVTSKGKKLLTGRARRLCPSLEGVEPSDAWAGLRPASPNQFPHFGPTPIEGLHLVTGLFRNGILLAPLVADLVGSAIQGDRGAIPETFRATGLWSQVP